MFHRNLFYVTFLSCAVLLSQAVSAQELKIAVPDFYPLAGKDSSGKAGGAYVEIVETVCKKLALKCTFELLPARRGEQMVGDGEMQMLVAYTKNAEREKKIRFTPPLTRSGYTFFVKKGTAGKYKSVQDFLGKEIGVYGPSGTFTSFEKVNKEVGSKLKFTQEADPAIPLKKLDGDRYVAAYANRAVGVMQAKTFNLNVEPVSFETDTVTHNVGLSKKGVSDELFQKVDKAVTELAKSPEGHAIIKKYQLIPELTK